jgi:DNA-directed RNA polymerase subunit RPC12/RpoP
MENDILKIHDNITEYYLEYKNNIHVLKKNHNELSLINTEFMSLVQKNKLEKCILELNELITIIESKDYIHYFNMDTIHLLDTYKYIINKPINHSFVNNDIESKLMIEKQNVVDRYKDIIQGYIFCDMYNHSISNMVPIDKEKVNEISTIHVCSVCNSKIYYIENNNTRICKDCGLQEFIKENENSPIILKNKYNYDRLEHFKECVRKFQGKNNIINPHVLQTLEDCFKRYNLIPYKGKVTKKHILLFLKENKMSKYYDDLNYLYCRYNECFDKYDISNIEHFIIDDYIKLLGLYDSMSKNTNKNRKNFISTQYVLYQLLKRHNFECSIYDFNIIKTTERRLYHENIVRDMFETLNWNHTATI